jgi:ferredoxin
MPYVITDECINCRACKEECPENAIESHKTRKKIERLSKKHFFVIPSKCNECKGFSELPLCLEICPMKCITKISGEKNKRVISVNNRRNNI